jgi:acetyl esterase/lipase
MNTPCRTGIPTLSLLPAIVALCTALGTPTARADAPGPPAATESAMQPIPTPDQPGALPLYPGTAPGSEGTTQVEQWEQAKGDRIARNVTRPTLTPFLPARGKATGAGVIVAPGGGYVLLSMDKEGYQVARWLADHGVAAFLLKYRVNPTPAGEAEFAEFGRRTFQPKAGPVKPADLPHGELAVADGQEALRMVRRRAEEWGVDPKRVGMVGFSAGAMTVLAVALKDAPDARPDFIAPIYGPMFPVEPPANAPPMFIARAADDPLLGLGGFGLVDSWMKSGAPVELHVYEHGGHGFGASHQGTTSDLWIQQFYAWMKARGELDAR